MDRENPSRVAARAGDDGTAVQHRRSCPTAGLAFGALVYSYANFDEFRARAARGLSYTINLGDYMQTLAVRHLYEKLGVRPGEIISIDRDTIRSYAGKPAVVIMNACFYEWCFPLPQAIVPVFVGFNADRHTIRKNRDFFKAHEPIGCRDPETTKHFHLLDVAAYTTGCLTLTFDNRQRPPSAGKILVVRGTGAGELPKGLEKHIPSDLLPSVEYVVQRREEHTFPLDPAEMRAAEAEAKRLLEYYRDSASLIVSPLHHAIAPAVASGIPVVLCRDKPDPRFGYLRKIIPLYLRRQMGRIDWSVRPIDIDPIRRRITDAAKTALGQALQRQATVSPRSRTAVRDEAGQHLSHETANTA